MRLSLTPRAAAELEEVLDFIASRSPQGAKNIQRRIQATMALLLRHPEAARVTSLTGLRRIVVKPYPYLIFYQATADEIIVHGVRHGARKS